MITIFAVLLVSQVTGLYSNVATSSWQYSGTSKTKATSLNLSEALPPASAFAVKEGNTFIFPTTSFSVSAKKLQDYKALIHHADVQGAISFSQFVHRAKNFIVHIRSKELLFPFHYFLESNVK